LQATSDNRQALDANIIDIDRKHVWWWAHCLQVLFAGKLSIWRYVGLDGKSFDGLMEPKLTPISDNCRNEHPPGQGNVQSQGNRFAPLNTNNNNNGGGARNRSGGFGSSGMSLPCSHPAVLSWGCRLLPSANYIQYPIPIHFTSPFAPPTFTSLHNLLPLDSRQHESLWCIHNFY
jgi:hypothetical protein